MNINTTKWLAALTLLAGPMVANAQANLVYEGSSSPGVYDYGVSSQDNPLLFQGLDTGNAPSITLYNLAGVTSASLSGLASGDFNVAINPAGTSVTFTVATVSGFNVSCSATPCVLSTFVVDAPNSVLGSVNYQLGPFDGYNTGGYSEGPYYVSPPPPPVPLPASVWLMLSGLVGVGAMARKHRAA
jgi:hypothetical protein